MCYMNVYDVVGPAEMGMQGVQVTPPDFYVYIEVISVDSKDFVL